MNNETGLELVPALTPGLAISESAENLSYSGPFRAAQRRLTGHRATESRYRRNWLSARILLVTSSAATLYASENVG